MDSRVVNALAAGSVAAFLYLGFGGLGAAATDGDPAALVKQREQTMKSMGGGLQTIAKFVKGEAGSAADVQAAVAAITEASSKDPAVVFPQGTAIGTADSDAKPELWQNWPKAVEYWNGLKPATAKLTEAANAGDRAQIAQALQGVSKACANCHEDFRQKKQ
ncbi:c-type cytochrome [Azospirillum rugosum]|uniref:Cytochrome c556 n=1 Tax=Azospirillum rugosum TaxID=416170 RepID=A0ABS4SLU4_9PROT|nr:cytochrome c [Azospirillum rugosum]MBP2293533.1 cytochrome c556 [Azospirillum rugosum]MDQ0529212.1 cytochrome c556 [Azospirillum rugosum]